MRRDLLAGINISKLSRAQKKALSLSAVVILAFVAAWSAIYLPARKSVGKLKAELADVNQQIKQIEDGVGGAGSLEQGIKLLEARLKNIKDRFPGAEEESIKVLASLAGKSRITVDSIRPYPREKLLDKDGAPVKIIGSDCYVISVAVAIKCSYADLVKFTQIIEKKLPAFAIIQKLNINSNPSNPQMLSVNMDLSLYLLASGN